MSRSCCGVGPGSPSNRDGTDRRVFRSNCIGIPSEDRVGDKLNSPPPRADPPAHSLKCVDDVLGKLGIRPASGVNCFADTE